MTIVRRWTPTVLHWTRGRLGYLAMRRNGVWLRHPYWIERWICWGVNRLLCAITGHDRILDGVTETYKGGRAVCPACSARYKPGR